MPRQGFNFMLGLFITSPVLQEPAAVSPSHFDTNSLLLLFSLCRRLYDTPWTDTSWVATASFCTPVVESPACSRQREETSRYTPSSLRVLNSHGSPARPRIGGARTFPLGRGHCTSPCQTMLPLSLSLSPSNGAKSDQLGLSLLGPSEVSRYAPSPPWSG